MKKLFALTLLALPVLAGAAQAGPFGPYKVEAGANAYFRVVRQPYGATPCGATCGPWYNYWPLEAHFQKPALGYPYWPSPQGAMTKDVVPGAPPGAPPAVPGPVAVPAVKPVGYQAPSPIPAGYRQSYPSYSQPGAAPSYWYGD